MKQLAFRDLCMISLAGGGTIGLVSAAAIVFISVKLSSTTTGVVAALFVFGMGTLAFGIALLLPVVLLNQVSCGVLIRWAYFVASGLGVGFYLPFVIGLLVGISPKVGAVAGVFGGVTCAWLWGYVKRYREVYPIEQEKSGRWLDKKLPPDTPQ